MPEVREPPATAGDVRRDGAERMDVADLDVRFPMWGRPVAVAFLVAAVLVPHLMPTEPTRYAFAFAATLVALEYVWRHVPKTVRGESIGWGVALGFLFFPAADAAGLSNGVVGPLFLLAAVLLSVYTFRRYPSYGLEPDAGTRISGLLILFAAMWGLIMLVRTLQNWPPW